MECLFCKMINGEIMTDKVYEDGDTLAFLDANPSAPGHTLVVPKVHKSNILELSEYELNNLFKTVQKVTEMINKNLKPEGFNIGINHGHIAGSRVPHLQVHIIPRFKDDKGGMIQMVVSNKPKEDNATIASRIKAGEELPDYIKRQIKDYHQEEKKEEAKESEKEKRSEEEKELEEREAELFPPRKNEVNSREFKKKIEEKEEEEEEDIYDKMLKRMRIPN